MLRTPTQDDLDDLLEFSYDKASELTGMTYADGIRDMIDWLDGTGNRPDTED